MFDPTTLTGFHTWLSLIAIVAGLFVIMGFLKGTACPKGMGLFLLTAVATSATGFLFPFTGLKPSHVVGVLALVILAMVLYALYVGELSGRWHAVYLVGAVASLYLLVFVGVAQAFAKVPALHGLAPTQSEPPFAIAQLVVLVAFLLLGYLALRARRPA